ncbi:hypothetical protein GPZ77_28560 [Streptomyces sp. QHH-9511]|uniref:phage baseplate protein n=1 Tax=Streptomyces sp. QHH-9511 TaxID=2684468 RepID=UPI001318A812|nr:hypothetical protein [Streptomyces sp. QHH-9511]QGZ51808.1 hypothetical protein GPZ77_28560 [Streptomyces sp. QHH-9511]
MSVTIEGQIDLAGPVGKLLHRRPLKNSTVMQSFGIDPVSGDVFVLQPMSGGIQLTGEPAAVDYATRIEHGDLCVTRLNPAGAITGHMYLRGFGHGVGMGLENRAGVIRLWTETASLPNGSKKGFGTAVTSFEFRSGTVLDHGSPLHTPPYRPGAGARFVTCTVDRSAGELVLRFELDLKMYFERYDLAKASAGVWEPIQRIPHPDQKGWFQGYTSHGGVLYMLSGMPIHPDYPENPPPGNTYLTAVDWTTGAILDQRLCVAAPGLEYREPEGMTVALRDGVPHLYFGFACEEPGPRTCTILFLSAAPETDGVKVLTDWQPLTLNAGVTADQNAPKGRLVSIAGATTLQLSGGVKGSFAADTAVATLPDSLTPTMPARANVPRNNTGGQCVARLEAGTDRQLRLFGGRDTNVITWAQLDGFSSVWR